MEYIAAYQTRSLSFCNTAEVAQSAGAGSRFRDEYRWRRGRPLKYQSNTAQNTYGTVEVWPVAWLAYPGDAAGAGAKKKNSEKRLTRTCARS
jgi:hypothetical protein